MAYKYNEIQNIIDEPPRYSITIPTPYSITAPPPYSITVNNSNNSNISNNLNDDCNLCCNYLDYINKKIRNWMYDFCLGLKDVIACCDCDPDI